MSRSLLVKLTAGASDPERCTLALTVAATALASGVGCRLWLAADATWLAVRGNQPDLPDGPGGRPLELLQSLLDAGAVVVCSQCLTRRDLGPADLVTGATVGGAAQFVEEVTADGTAALVY